MARIIYPSAQKLACRTPHPYPLSPRHVAAAAPPRLQQMNGALLHLIICTRATASASQLGAAVNRSAARVQLAINALLPQLQPALWTGHTV